MSRVLVLTTVVLLGAPSAPHVMAAALLPAVSEQLNGLPVPEFRASTVDGRVLSSDDLCGKGIAVNFFASWCPACQMEIGKLRELEPELRLGGVSVIGVLV